MQLSDLDQGSYLRGSGIRAALLVLGIDAWETPVLSRVVDRDADDLYEVWVPTDIGLVIAEHEIKRVISATSEARIVNVIPWSEAPWPTAKVSAWRDKDRLDADAYVTELRFEVDGIDGELRSIAPDQHGDPEGVTEFAVEYLKRLASHRA